RGSEARRGACFLCPDLPKPAVIGLWGAVHQAALYCKSELQSRGLSGIPKAGSDTILPATHLEKTFHETQPRSPRARLIRCPPILRPYHVPKSRCRVPFRLGQRSRKYA